MDNQSALSAADEFIDELFKNASVKMSKIEDMKEVARGIGFTIDHLVHIRNSRQQNKTLLHVAAGYGRKSWVADLISDGADVNAQDDEGQTPLHAACNHAHKNVAKLLIEAGADVNLVDNRGWPPLHFAISRRVNAEKIQTHYWEVIELLLDSGANPCIRSNSKKNSFDRVKDLEQKLWILIYHVSNEQKICDNPARDEMIIDKYLKPHDFFELLIEGDEHIEMFKILTTPKLLRSTLENYDNITPLHRAAGRNHLAVAQLFIELGANVNATDNDGCLPLHNAAQWGHVEMIELLINEGSDINRQDIKGFSPLHTAASNRTFFACLKLIELGANVNLRDNTGALPYDLAESKDVREVLKPDLLKMVRTVQSTSEQAIYIGYQEDCMTESNYQHYKSTHDTLMLDSTSDKRLFSNPMHQIKKIILDKSDPRYQLVKKRMVDTIVHHANDLGGRFNDYEIISIEYILHEKVWSKYRLKCKTLEIDHRFRNERLLFHGSNFINKIQACGFDERYAQRNGMFGAGIYFAVNSSKSNQYTFGWGQGCQEHNNKSCYSCERKMIYAQVALGKSLHSKEAMPDCAHAPPGYSSVAGLPGTTDELMYPEYVIYSGDQAYPLFVITYRIKPPNPPL